MNSFNLRFFLLYLEDKPLFTYVFQLKDINLFNVIKKLICILAIQSKKNIDRRKWYEKLIHGK